MEITDTPIQYLVVNTTPELAEPVMELTDEIILSKHLDQALMGTESLTVPESSRFGQAIHLLGKEVNEQPRLEHMLLVKQSLSGWRKEDVRLNLSEMLHGDEDKVGVRAEELTGAAISLHNHPLAPLASFFSEQDIETTVKFKNQAALLLIPHEEGQKEYFLFINQTGIPDAITAPLLELLQKMKADYQQKSEAALKKIDSLFEEKVGETELQAAISEYFELLEDRMFDLFSTMETRGYLFFRSIDGKNFKKLTATEEN